MSHQLRALHDPRDGQLANPETRTVAEIATDLGFWELGRFSVAFRKLFRESPSVTLRRSAKVKSMPSALFG